MKLTLRLVVALVLVLTLVGAASAQTFPPVPQPIPAPVTIDVTVLLDQRWGTDARVILYRLDNGAWRGVVALDACVQHPYKPGACPTPGRVVFSSYQATDQFGQPVQVLLSPGQYQAHATKNGFQVGRSERFRANLGQNFVTVSIKTAAVASVMGFPEVSTTGLLSWTSIVDVPEGPVEVIAYMSGATTTSDWSFRPVDSFQVEGSGYGLKFDRKYQLPADALRGESYCIWQATRDPKDLDLSHFLSFAPFAPCGLYAER